VNPRVAARAEFGAKLLVAFRVDLGAVAQTVVPNVACIAALT
jgi:hypothetical protein